MKCIEDEIPFELPQGWEWTRLGNIATVKGGKRIPKGYTCFDEITPHAYIRVTNMKNQTILLDDIKYISNDVYEMIKTYTISKDDLYITIAGTIGVVGEVPLEMDGMNLTENAAKITCFGINKYFLLLMLQTDFVQKQFRYKTYQVAMPKLGLERIVSTLVPVCPISESNAIYSRYSEVLSILSNIDSNKENLKDTISTAKSKILDLAIRGKLVPQDENDEPASVLLERIRAEKEEMIKSGKIKRDKKESVIFKGEDNSYYQDIPGKWQITSLREITTPLILNDGDWILSENMSLNGDVKLLQLGSIGNMVYIDKGFKYLTKQTFNDLSCTEIYSGYLLINRIISDKMCCCIIPSITGTIITTVDTCWIAPSPKNYNLYFLMYQLASSIFQSQVLMSATGTTRKRISKNNLIDLPLYAKIHRHRFL